jgi:uncharacterized protein (TIGR02145 family)
MFQYKKSNKTNRRNQKGFILSFIFLASSNMVICQNINVQQTQVVVNPVVIERPVYIEKYRTVYVDRPQPKRVARKLSAPVQLLGYLWVHTEDLGNFRQHPVAVIQNINAQNPHGRDNWRIPTHDELMVMEANANTIGLGDDMYMATSHSNGVLRLVSTGKSIAEKRASASEEIEINGVIWATRNVASSGAFVSSPRDKGQKFSYSEALTVCPPGWRLPTREEFISLVNAGSTWKEGGREFPSKYGNLFLPSTDERNTGGMYWTSSFHSREGRSSFYWALLFSDREVYTGAGGFPTTTSVRCVK